jgi:hypothetical protein
MSLLAVIYIAIALFAVMIYLLSLFELKAKKKQIGAIQTQWSSKFNLTIKINWIIWAAVLAYLSWSLYLIIAEPYRKNEYIFLLVFILFLSFYPRWITVIGSKGIISGMEVFLWENLKEWKIFSRGRSQYLELKWDSGSVLPELKTKRIPLPIHKEITLPALHNQPPN